MEVIFGSLCVPMHLSIPWVSCQNSFISPAPTSQPQKHTPGVIQSSPHTHPNHKKNKMGNVTQPSPDSYISHPPFPPGPWRRLSCSAPWQNVACVFFSSCVHFRFGTNLTQSKPTTNTENSIGQGPVFLVLYPYFFPLLGRSAPCKRDTAILCNECFCVSCASL